MLLVEFILKNYLYRVFCVCILGLPGILFSQKEKVSFQHLNIENGLSNNDVNGITQDDDGYMWFCTNNGINKFNAHSSKVFYPNNLDLSGDRKTDFGCAFKDSRGRLWFGGNGLILCNPKDDSFIVFQHEQLNPSSINNNDISEIIEDQFANIWIGTRLGLAMYNESKGNFTRYLHDTIGSVSEVYRKNRIIDMLSDGNGNLWMTTHKGLYQFTLNDKKFTPFLLHPEQKNSRFANQSRSLGLDKTGKIWINYYDDGLYQMDVRSGQYTKISFPNSEMNEAAKKSSSILCDSKGNIWISCSLNGLLYYNREDSSWLHFRRDLFNAKSLSENKTACLYEDRAGIIWIGTSGRGVDRVSMNSEKFMNYILQPGKPYSLCENDNGCAREDHYSNLWIGSRNGLMYFHRTLNKFTCYFHDSKNSNSLSDNYIYSLEVDSLNNVWVATDNGLNYFRTKSKTWTCYKNKETDINSIPSRVIFDVRLRRNGEVWVATSEGIGKLIPGKGIFENRLNNAQLAKLPHAYFLTVYEDCNQNMWLSTARSGIYLVNDSFKILHRYSKSNGFNANLVHQFDEDSSGTLWMATDHGVYYKFKQTDTIRKLITSDPVLNGDIMSIVVETKSKIWVSTIHGLLFIQLDSNNTIQYRKLFTDKDGLQSKAFNSFAGTRLKSGELYFGGINGFNIFNPSSIQYNSYIPPVKLISFKVRNKEIRFSEYAKDHGSLELNYDQNDFSFEMASLNYDVADNNQYGYQLVSYDKDWVYSGTNRFAQYTNVPPGHYQLKIIGSNNDGLWNHNGYVLNLTIHPPYWRTTWFLVLMILLSVCALGIIYSLRINSIRKQEKLKSGIEKKIAEARSIALRAQMNPHFIFNSLNSIQYLISESDKFDAHKYLSKFSRLMRRVLENSAKNMNTVASEIEMLELYLELESLRFANKFTYEINTGDDPSILNIKIPAMLLHPFVENAILHGLLNKPDSGHLKIVLETDETQLTCIIEDNGIGRDEAEHIKANKMNAHRSLGLKVTEDRMKMIEVISNKKAQVKIVDLYDSNGSAMGTRVIIVIPIEMQL
jgi:ligand-binding sensor domain-containing protein